MPLSVRDFPFFKDMGTERLNKGARVLEPTPRKTHDGQPNVNFDQMKLIAMAKLDAFIHWCGGDITAPYDNPHENQAWSAVVGTEIYELSQFGEPIRPAQQRLR